MGASPEATLKRLGISLPPPPKPAGSYAPVVVEGAQAWVAGQIWTEGGVVQHPGLVGQNVEFATAKDAARHATLQGLSALSSVLGSLDRIAHVLRVAVYVASAPGFTRQHEVANGATELLMEVFGESGRPARVSMGVASLPLNAPVEVELLVATL